MEVYYITGASKGIGKALAEKILNRKNSKVIGLSRSQSIQHDRYQHVSIDLSELNAVDSFAFGEHTNAQKVVLVNNAGTLGEIGHVGRIFDASIIKEFNLNLTAPAVLINKFIKKYRNDDHERLILNVSSGAGKKVIDGWAGYCATKAGLDAYSQVVDHEQKAFENQGIRILSVGPGIVDTEMQTQIRNTRVQDFSNVQKFKDYKAEGELKAPDEIARLFLKVIDNQKDFNNPVFSLRDLNEY